MKYIYKEKCIKLDESIEIPDGSIAITITYNNEFGKIVSWLEPMEEK